MSERINYYSTVENGELEITNVDNGGFFSCSSSILRSIHAYCNRYNSLPIKLITNTMYFPYNYMENHSNILHSDNDIYSHFFLMNNENSIITEEDIDNMNKIENKDYQYDDYKTLPFTYMTPFIRKYFTPSSDIDNYIEQLEKKYISQYDGGYDNICVLFYRGNDKNTETKICGYQDIINKAREVYKENPNITFLIQSDETDFLNQMVNEFSNSFRFSDEYICHIMDKTKTVQNIFSKEMNYEYAKKYLAVTIVMSKCKFVICTTGNCSIWITYFRGNSNNVYQYLIDKWV